VAWLKALHIVTLLVWCAGLFYLPGLFAAHPRTPIGPEFRRLRAITRFTFVVIASPAAVLAILSGTALVYATGVEGAWMVLKLGAVTLMVLFHLYCGRVLGLLGHSPASRSPAAHLALLLPPALLIPAVLWLVLGKPV